MNAAGSITVIIPACGPCGGADALEQSVSGATTCAGLFDGKVDIITSYPCGGEESVSERDGVSVRYIPCGEDESAPSVVNRCVEASGSDYVCVCPSGDRLAEKWLRMFAEYLSGREDVSVFLPVVSLSRYDSETGFSSMFANDIALATSFADPVGYADYEGMSMYPGFDISGGVFKRSEWNGMREDMLDEWGYEYLLRAARAGQKIYVVPKIGVTKAAGEASCEAGGRSREEWNAAARRMAAKDMDAKVSFPDNKKEELK